MSANDSIDLMQLYGILVTKYASLRLIFTESPRKITYQQASKRDPFQPLRNPGIFSSPIPAKKLPRVQFLPLVEECLSYRPEML